MKSEWVLKQNSKGKYEKSFFVATTAALYITTQSGLWNTVKIKNVCPWVDLKSIHVLDHNEVLFQFDGIKLRIRKDDAISLITPIVSFLKALLVDTEEVEYNIPFSVPPSSLPKDQFIHLFVSCSLSLENRPNSKLLQPMKKNLLKNMPLTMVIGPMDLKFTAAFCRSLSLTRNVQKLIVGGLHFSNLYGSLSIVIKQNPTLEDITIQDHQSATDFNKFVESIPNSGIRILRFIDSLFTREMAQTLVTINLPSNIKHIKFSNCNLTPQAYEVFFNNVTSFSKLNCLEICKDEHKMPDYLIPKLLTFVSDAEIEQIKLKKMDVDLYVIMKSISSDSLYLTKMNLSHNYCSKVPENGFSFPLTLTKLALRDVLWKDESLAQFLTLQPFSSNVKIDFSNAQFPKPTVNPLSSLPSSPTHSSFQHVKWNKNPMTVKLLELFANTKTLKTVYFDECRLFNEDRPQILAAMSSFLNVSKLQKLSVAKTFKSYRADGLAALQAVLSSHKTLQYFNYSGNNIGDEGLQVLGQILTQNKSIEYLRVDDSNLTDPNVFLEFLRSLTKVENLVHVSKPRKDIKALCKTNKAAEGPIKQLWDALSQENERKWQESQNLSEMSFFSTGVFSTIDSSTSGYETFRQIPIETTWDITVDIGYLPNNWEYEEITFSYDKILNTNLPILEEDDFQTLDPSNILDLQEII